MMMEMVGMVGRLSIETYSDTASNIIAIGPGQPSMKSSSAPSTPTSELSSSLPNRPGLGNTFSTSFNAKSRKVNFPSDDLMVTGYSEPPDPWIHIVPQQLTPENLVDAYRSSCEKQGIKPIAKLLHQLEGFSCFDIRQQDLSLRGEKLDSKHIESLEEVFKRVQFNTIDIESCNLDDEGSAALFDMIEYYESASRLNVSNNQNIDCRGWQACCRMLKKTSSLQHLHLRSSGLNEQIMLVLGRSLRLGSHLVTLHFESSGINGRALVILVAALKLNSTLRELYLSDNKISPNDGVQICNLFRANSTLELLDLHENNVQDIGLGHICEGLTQQPIAPGDGLKTLILSNNQITSKGMVHLVESLPFCRALRGLNLSNNSITNDGIIHLKEGLVANPTLCFLGLKNTNITDEGCVAIAEYLTENNKISRIDLRENKIDFAGLMTLAVAVKHNKSITKLDIDPCFQSNNNEVSSDIEDYQKILNDIITSCSLNEENSAEDAETCIQGLESPQPFEQDPSSIPLLSMNGLFKSRSPVINIPSGSKNHDITVSPSFKNRFQVSRVCLERENISAQGNEANLIRCTTRNGNQNNTHENCGKVHTARKPILRSTSLGSWDNRFKEKRPDVRRSGRFSVSPVPDPLLIDIIDACETEEVVKPEILLTPELIEVEDTDLMVCSETLKEDDEAKDNITEMSSETLKKKITFLLPEGHATSVISSPLKDRRMSTPVMSEFSKPITRPKIPSLKMCTTLDSLDLRSSVPLSPTRLYQGIEFPDTLSLKLAPEVEEAIMKLELY